MKSADFCPICGKTEARFIKGFCEECYQKKHALVEFPSSIEFGQCRQCAKIRVSQKMLPLDSGSLALIAEKSIKVHELENPVKSVSIKEDSGGFFAEVAVKGTIDSVPMLFEKKIPLKPKPILCDACMRLSSQYFEAIIQIRGNDRQKLRQAFSLIKNFFNKSREKDSLAAITESSEKGGRIDLKIGSKKAAYHAAKLVEREFGAQIKVSKKLVGVDDNKQEKYRFTFLVRI